jgi:hypothetical protein
MFFLGRIHDRKPEEIMTRMPDPPSPEFQAKLESFYNALSNEPDLMSLVGPYLSAWTQVLEGVIDLQKKIEVPRT